MTSPGSRGTGPAGFAPTSGLLVTQATLHAAVASHLQGREYFYSLSCLANPERAGLSQAPTGADGGHPVGFHCAFSAGRQRAPGPFPCVQRGCLPPAGETVFTSGAHEPRPELPSISLMGVLPEASEGRQAKVPRGQAGSPGFPPLPDPRATGGPAPGIGRHTSPGLPRAALGLPGAPWEP